MNDSSIKALKGYIQSPEIYFDRYLSEHKDCLDGLSKIQLKYLVDIRERYYKLNLIHQFNREELEFCIKEGVAEPSGMFLQVYNDFLIADSFFGE